MKNFQILGVLFFLFLYSCASDTTPRQELTANFAHGKVNQILVVSDSSVWKGAVGDTFFYFFSGPYLLLPQPEPIFDIKHLTPEELAKQTVKKEFRTIIFLADLNDVNSSTASLVKKDVGPEKIEEARKGKGYNTIVGKDKWAKNQLLFYVFGLGEEKLLENISKNFAPVARRINESDLEVVKATTYQAGENSDLELEIKTAFDLNMKVPGDFRKALFDQKSNTMWLRRSVREVDANILIHKLPYTNKSQLTKAGIKGIRDKIGKIITAEQPDSYMRINDIDLPLFTENKMVNNRYTVQAKGIWETVNAFFGGPFISNLMLNADTGELYLVDAFIYAPGKDKRNYMQEMELILSSASF